LPAPVCAVHIDSAAMPVNNCTMDIEDNLPLRQNDPLIAVTRQDLDPLSVAELQERIELLKGEIARSEAKIAFATSHRSAADALFKK
jgi:uncharacterized small protein (DUF1192 family)